MEYEWNMVDISLKLMVDISDISIVNGIFSGISQWNMSINYISRWWFGTFFLCFHILGIIISTDFYIFQRGRSTTNQIYKWAMFSSIFRYFSELIG